MLVKEKVIVSLLAGAILSKNIVILELWVCNISTSSTIFEIGSEGGFPPSNKSFPPMLNRTISDDEIVAGISSIFSSTSSVSYPPTPSWSMSNSRP